MKHRVLVGLQTENKFIACKATSIHLTVDKWEIIGEVNEHTNGACQIWKDTSLLYSVPTLSTKDIQWYNDTMTR